MFLDGVYLSRPGVALGDLFDVEQIRGAAQPPGHPVRPQHLRRCALDGAYRDFKAESVQDSEYVGLDVYKVSPGFANGFETFDDIETWTHELRLQGVHGRLDWLVGAYYSDETIVEEQSMGKGDDYGQYISATGWFGAILPALNGLPAAERNALAALPLAAGGTLGDVLASPNPAVAFAGGIDPSGAFANNVFEQEGQSWSAFTHNSFALTDKLDLVLGLRWTEEEKDGSFNQLTASSPACASTLANAAGLPAAASTVSNVSVALMCFPFTTQASLSPVTPAGFDQSFQDEELIYTLEGVYDFTPEIKGYASFTHGFKAGGFNLDPTAATGGADPSFDSELDDSWEIGVKSDLFDRTVRANVAAFDMEMEDFQVLSFTGVQFQTFNVDKAESTGIEIATVTSPVDGLDLSRSYT